jgi:hypothetical protein
MESEIKYLGDVQRLTMEPGDVLVLSVHDEISQEAAARLKEQVLATIGTDRKVMVLSRGMKVGVLAAA